MSTTTSPNTPMNLCFNNSLILQTIFKFGFRKSVEYCSNPMTHSKLRLVNKRFNAEYLHFVRKTHKKIEIRYEHPYEEHGSRFLVNSHSTNSKKAPGLFRFLTEVAQVKVEEFRLATSFYWPSSITEQQSLHDLVILFLRDHNPKVFTGFADFCEHGCMDCEVHAVRCEEADLQFDVLRLGFANRRKHFKKLMITSLLIRHIAIYCTSLSNTKEQCLEVLSSLITSNISCDHLQFALDGVLIHQSQWGRENFQTEPVIPLEVLTRILEVWKPKSIDLKFHSYRANNRCPGPWVENSFFSGFRFDTDPQVFRQNFLAHTGFLFEKVEVDVDDCSPLSDGGEPSDFARFVENVRTLFPTDYLVLASYELVYDNTFYREFGRSVLEHMLQLAATPQPFRITVQIAVGSNDGFEIPETFFSGNRRFHCSAPTSETIRASVVSYPDLSFFEYIGKTLRITDDRGKFQLDLEIYVGEDEFERAQKTEEQIDYLKKGFFKHFL